MAQTHGHVKPKQHGGYRRSRLQKYESTLLAWLQAEPNLTLKQLKNVVSST